MRYLGESQLHRHRSRMGAAMGWGRERCRAALFKGCKVSVWEEEKVLKMDSTVGYTTVGRYLTLPNSYT